MPLLDLSHTVQILRPDSPCCDRCGTVEPLEDLAEKKLCGPVCPLGGKAGELTAEWAARLGLRAGTAVGISIIDV